MSDRITAWSWRCLCVALSLLFASPAAALVGDCDGNGQVAINELITGVNIALETALIADCPLLDVNGDGKAAINELVAAVSDALDGVISEPAFRFLRPEAEQLSLVSGVGVSVSMPVEAMTESLLLLADGRKLDTAPTVEAGRATATIDFLSEGVHTLAAEVRSMRNGSRVTLRTETSIETVDLLHPDECEVLNNAECLLPYPSSRFLEPAETPTGWRTNPPAVGAPTQYGVPLDVETYRGLDGFSPTVQVLMHFPGGVDPVKSNASRLLPATRTTDLRSLDPDSPTVLLDADTGERLLHFIEPDIRAENNPARQAVFLRPARSLTPGHRYIVAVRNLRRPDGTAVRAEPAFAALRDNRPTDIGGIASRRAPFADIFDRLAAAGIARDALILAFDFVVQSDTGLTGQMLAMRDQALAWLAEEIAAGNQRATFAVERVSQNDCAQPGQFVWRVVEGTFQVPLFLTSDPEADPVTPGVLNLDADGMPVQNGFTNPPFTIAIPCHVLAPDASPAYPLVAGHGLFGTGRGMVNDLISEPEVGESDYLVGATDWRGLSSKDVNEPGPTQSFLVSQVIFRLNNFAALPDRLRQGQLNTLILGRMMKQGVFNAAPMFRTPANAGVFPGPEEEMYYFGASLGGIMGLMFAALSPDIEHANVDVPAMNFSLLLQRATPYLAFEAALEATGVTDPIQSALVLGLGHELWVRGESAGYATHITSNPLPGTNAKRILMTMAFLDQQVSNQATEIAARTLGLPSLDGSLLSGLPQIPDRAGPLPSALVVYDTGSFDLGNPAHAPFIPPLANLQPEPNDCDPHGRRALIPASLQQLFGFLRPGGMIESFCNGPCDAGDPFELPFGATAPCDPLQ